MRKTITEKIKRSIKKIEKAEKERVRQVTMLQANFYSWFCADREKTDLASFLQNNDIAQSLEKQLPGFTKATPEAIKICSQTA